MHVPSIQLTPCKGRWRNATSLLACPLASDRQLQISVFLAKPRPPKLGLKPESASSRHRENLVNRQSDCSFVSSSLSPQGGDGATPSCDHPLHSNSRRRPGGVVGTLVDETLKRAREGSFATLRPASRAQLSEHGSACPRFVAKALRLHLFDPRACGPGLHVAQCRFLRHPSEWYGSTLSPVYTSVNRIQANSMTVHGLGILVNREGDSSFS